MNKSAIAVVLTAFIILQLVVFTTQTESRISILENPIQRHELSYAPHVAMNISSNADFTLHGWNGSGTEGNPYSISGLSFDAPICLWIENTTAHFSIENCYFTHGTVYGGTAIRMYNATNGNIESCEFEEICYCIDMGRCNDTSIQFNDIRNVSRGIECFFTFGVDIVSNTIENVSSAMESYYAIDSIITSNLVYDCTWSGVQLGGWGNGSVFSDNEIHHVYDELWVYGALFIGGDNWVIEENYIHDSRSGITCDVFFVESCNITDNEITNCNDGIYLVGDDMLIESNDITDVIRGITMYDSDRAIIQSNSIDSTYEGISVYSSLHCTITNNQLTGGGIEIDGMSISHFRHEIIGNTINDKPIGYLLDEEESEISETQYGQLILVNCTGVVVSNQILERGSFGIRMAYCIGCEIRDSILRYNKHGGVHIEYCNYIVIEGCTIFNNGALYYSYGGILIRNANGTQILGNLIYKNNGSGISGSELTNSLIYNNLITNNTLSGISLGSHSDNNRVYGNAIGWNELGDASDNGHNNQWDDGASLGNWWANYDSEDSEIYVIGGGGNSQDHYPREFEVWASTLPLATGEIGLEIILLSIAGVVIILVVIIIALRRR